MLHNEKKAVHDIGVYSAKRCTEREYRKRISHELKEDNEKTDKTEKAQETNDVPKTDEAENNQAAMNCKSDGNFIPLRAD